MDYTIVIASDGMAYIPRIMMNISDTGVILRLCLYKMRCCNIRFTDCKKWEGKPLWRWVKVEWRTFELYGGQYSSSTEFRG
jgi:hypothetical protein